MRIDHSVRSVYRHSGATDLMVSIARLGSNIVDPLVFWRYPFKVSNVFLS